MVPVDCRRSADVVKRWLVAGVLAVLAAAAVIHEVWWARRFDDQETP